MPRIQKRPECSGNDCKKIPVFNNEGEFKPLYCGHHKLPNMVDVYSKRCLECKKQPSYNYTNQKTNLYCKDHKKPNMINVKSKRCLECNKIPSYNFKDEKTKLYCTDHKKSGMVNIMSKRCMECNKISCFNYKDTKIGIYCVDHKKDNMVDVRSKKCMECDKQPFFNYKNQTKAMYCGDHRLENMVDVKSKKCMECDKQPAFNYKNELNPLYCKDHKKPNMENVVSKRCLSCTKQPHFNYKSEKTGLYCDEHQLPNMVNIHHKPCKDCGLSYYKLYDDLCVSCHPEKQKIQHKKEQTVADFLTKTFPQQPFVRDKYSTDIKTCTGKYIRPDFVLAMDDKIIIVECDENQHESYPEECESTRMINLSMVYGGLPVIFIRYNPDTFRLNEDVQKVPQKKRLERLGGVLKEHIERQPETFLHVDYLFYDDDRQQRLEETTEFLSKGYI